MAEQAAEIALARVDRALARIEAAVRRSGTDRAALERRHAALRAGVTEAVAALDSLIAGERR